MLMEDTNSCPAFIERQEDPFTTTFEIHHSPNLSRLSMHFGSSLLHGNNENDDDNDEDDIPRPRLLVLDTPPTPPYHKSSHRSPKRTPPSPTVLRDISNASGVPPFIKRRCMYSPRRSASVSSIPIRRLYDMYENEGISIEEPTPNTLNMQANNRKRPFFTNSTSSLPSIKAYDNNDVLGVSNDASEATCEEPEMSNPLYLCSDSAILPPIREEKHEEKHEEERVLPILSTIPGSCTDYNRINGSTLKRLLSGEFDEKIEKLVIMDCRYEYEYTGGHIKTAIHMSPEQIFDYFREMPEPVRASHGGKRRTVIIMHCEYSTVRAPACIRLLRHYDRSVNHHRGFTWPLCSFPDVYLLDGGYRKFFDSFKEDCDPQAYVPENSKQHQKTRVIHKRTRKEQLRRSQSFSA